MVAPTFFFHAPKTKIRSERAPIPIAKTNGGIIEKYESLGNSRGSIVKDTMMNRVQSASFLTRKIEPMMMMAAFRDNLLKFSSCVLKLFALLNLCEAKETKT